MLVITSLEQRYYRVMGTRKKYEVRIAKHKFAKLKRGDFLLAFKKNGKGEFKLLQIVEAKKFRNVKDLFNTIDFRKVIPGVRERYEAEQAIYRIYGRKVDDVGVICFKIKVVGRGKITREIFERYNINL